MAQVNQDYIDRYLSEEDKTFLKKVNNAIAYPSQPQKVAITETIAINPETYGADKSLIKTEKLSQRTLTSLISSGADAQQNLFKVTIKGGLQGEEFNSETKQNLNLTFRISDFNAPEKSISIQKIPYQGTEFNHLVPGVSLTRQLDFNIRIDNNYQLYWFLHRIFPGDDLGNFDLEILKKGTSESPYNCTIIVEALKPTTSVSDPLNWPSVYRWEFFDCFLIKIPQLSFNYTQATPQSGVFSFIFGKMNEGPASQFENSSSSSLSFSIAGGKNYLLNQTLKQV